MTRFDRLADRASEMVAHAGFFALCVLLVVAWVPSYFLVGSVDTWQLIINTATTIVTFLLVALLHNTQHRFEQEAGERLVKLEEHLPDVAGEVGG